MSEYFKGVTFANQHLSPADDAVIRCRLISDGVLTGCEISHTRDTLSMAPGYLMACGRQIQHPSAEDWKVTYSLATSKTASGTVIALSDASDGPLQGLRIYGRTTQDGTPTPDNPVPLVSVGDGGSVEVTIAGRNLLKYPYEETTKTVNGITFTDSGDGSISINGTATNDAYFYFANSKSYPILTNNGKLTFSASGIVDGIAVQFWDKWADIPGVGALSTSNRYAVSEVGNVNGLNARIRVYSGKTITNLIVKVMIEAGSTVHDWEPYTAQTLPVSTPNGLLGVQVTSGGNYTDADGKQWLCDEVDLARGVYVQRVALLNNTFFSSNKELILAESIRFRTTDKSLYPPDGDINALCTHYARADSISENPTSGMFYVYKYEEWDYFRIRFANDKGFATWDDFYAWLDENDLCVIYPLATPIETPIQADELAAYAALHTNRTNTTVYNDAGAYMDVGYYPQDDAIPSNGYARVLMTIDMTRTSTEDVFDQVNTSIEYADTEDGFPALVQDDINREGSVYQLPLAVASIENGIITGITDSIGNAEPI